MIRYARLSPGPGFRPFRAIAYYIQRLIVSIQARRAISRCIAAVLNHLHPMAGPATISHAATCCLERLDRNGVAMLGPVLSAEALSRIEAYLHDRSVITPDGAIRSLDGAAEAPMASYPLDVVIGCPELLSLVNSPMLLEIATRYLGCVPTLSSIALRWSFPSSGAIADTQRFHRDTDDWRFLKLFVYLTDVDASAGPHMFVTGSHRTAGRIRARPYTLEEIKRIHGSDSIRTITGPRGFGFIADAHGIHRGTAPQSRARLLLQAQYSLLPVSAYLYDPVSIRPRPAFDFYINRLMLKA